MTELFRIRLQASAVDFQAHPDQTLLAAAETAGVALPSSCRNGTCRTCRQQLVSGSVAYRIPWPGLLAEEKEEGWILPCVAYASSDLVITGQAAGLASA